MANVAHAMVQRWTGFTSNNFSIRRRLPLIETSYHLGRTRDWGKTVQSGSDGLNPNALEFGLRFCDSLSK
jgi:hypothetical protein